MFDFNIHKMEDEFSTIIMLYYQQFIDFIHKKLCFQHSYAQINTQIRQFYPQLMHTLWTKRMFSIEQSIGRPNVL